MNNLFTSFPKLKTERLTLRELSFNDIKAVFDLRSSEEINKLITRKTPAYLEEAKEFISVCHSEFKNQNRVFWAMEFNKEVIGTIVFHNISLKDNYAEIGYELNPKFQQKGFMSEAMNAVLEFGKTKMKFKTIEAFTHKNNIPSITLLEKYNFVLMPERKCKSVADNRIYKLEI